eukprot:TRINITY_DN67142_c5_g1_i1.p1 TRINITY_DN67142_c5_g1~~TRINITY_DN67142_c5_g1_i1.p1  ORF type:complete len:515 (+),score=41.77 TRINITY_DN67142_c5_g1_i1:27-1571(+)
MSMLLLLLLLYSASSECVVHSIETVNSAGETVYYDAAAIEHLPAQSGAANVTQEVANAILNANIAIYEMEIARTTRDRVEIIVFPELGTTGTAGLKQYSDLLPYCQVVPAVGTLGCGNPGVSSGVIQRLSCAAKKHNVAVVANIAEVVWNKQKPNGRQQYNTDVIFNSSGVLVGVYRKTHLTSFDQRVFDWSPTQELVTFKTKKNITFAVFTCYDILFRHPTVDLLKLGVKDFVFPTWWVDFSYKPRLKAIAVQRGWSLANKVNMIAAGVGLTSDYSGSGIYNKGDPVDFHEFVNPYDMGETEVYGVLSTPAGQQPTQRQVEQLKKIQSQQRMVSGVSRSGQSLTVHSSGLLELGSGWQRDDNRLGFARFNSSQVNGTVSASSGALVCTFTWENTQHLFHENWALIVFSGTTYGGYKKKQLPLQLCGVQRCLDPECTALNGFWLAYDKFDKVSLTADGFSAVPDFPGGKPIVRSLPLVSGNDLTLYQKFNATATSITSNDLNSGISGLSLFALF